MKDQKNSHLTRILSLTFVGLGAYLLYLLVNDQGASVGTSGYKFKQDINSQQKVNDHLISTAAKIALDKEKAELMIRKAQNETYSGTRQEEYKNPEELDVTYDSSADQIHKIVRSHSDASVENQPVDPNEMIQSKIFDEEKLSQYSEEYKRQYAEKFVENARKGGWDVFLDEEYRVIKVRPVKKAKAKFNIFDKNSSSEE